MPLNCHFLDKALIFTQHARTGGPARRGHHGAWLARLPVLCGGTHRRQRALPTRSGVAAPGPPALACPQPRPSAPLTLGGNGGLPNPPSRSVWYYPARSIGGQAAISAGFQRNWYKTSAFKPNACDNQVAGQTCDEFPFWSTNQAVNLSGMTADLKLTPTAEGRSQGNDISAFYRECQVNNNEKFIVLPVAPWIAAGGPSFGFRVTDDGASLCLAPSVPTP
jgi:hypothetical protein